MSELLSAVSNFESQAETAADSAAVTLSSPVERHECAAFLGAGQWRCELKPLHNALSGQSVPGIEVGAKKGAGADDAAQALAIAIKTKTSASVKLVNPYETDPSFGASVGGGLEEPAKLTLLIGSK
jgi:hypothetical protein